MTPDLDAIADALHALGCRRAHEAGAVLDAAPVTLDTRQRLDVYGRLIVRDREGTAVLRQAEGQR